MITCTEGTAIDHEPRDPRARGPGLGPRPARVRPRRRPAPRRRRRSRPTSTASSPPSVEARERGLRVVAQCGGHGASRLGPLDDALLLRTAGLAGVEIDARAHRARIKAGARWADLADRASFLGLAPAGGFDREASIVGTVLGDGMGWLARRHGVAARGRDRRRVRDPRGRARAQRRSFRCERRDHRARARAAPGRGSLRRRAVLLLRPRRRGAARVARLDRDGARARSPPSGG